jgi:hypothetical protein
VQSVGGAKVLLVAIISPVGVALSGLAAFITAFATLGVLRDHGKAEKPLTTPPCPAGAELSRPEAESSAAEGGRSEPLTQPRTVHNHSAEDESTPPPPARP